MRGATIGVALLVLLLFAGRVWLLPARFSTDPNEGWNAFHAALAVGGGRLYPPPGSLTGDNYPPLSFFVVGWAGRLIGDGIVAGRLIALVSLLIVAALVFASAREICGKRARGPIIGALLFLAFNATLFRRYLGMDDPQWLGHGLMMIGVFLLVAGGACRPPGWRVAVAALLMLAGGLTKQNLLAFPLAATVWLAIVDRRALLVWTATSAVGLLATGCLLHLAYGGAVFEDILASDRHYSWLRMVLRSAGPVAAMLPMTLVALRLFRLRALDRRIGLVLLLVAVSVPLGIIERSGQGVDGNAHFEAVIALSLATGVALERCDFVSMRSLAWLIAPFLILLPGSLHADVEDLLHRRDREIAWSVMQDRVTATPGQVACQTPAICYWAGKDFEIDFFLYGQYALQHDPAMLQRALAERRFSAIELDREPARSPAGELASPLPAIILRDYHSVLADDAGRRLLVPRAAPSLRPLAGSG